MKRTTKASLEARLDLLRKITGNPSLVMERWGSPSRIQLDDRREGTSQTHVSPALQPAAWMDWSQAYIMGWEACRRAAKLAKGE